jgi:P-type Cu2+ transporter
MAGSSIVVVLNSLRLERLPEPAPSAATESVPPPRSTSVLVSSEALQAG